MKQQSLFSSPEEKGSAEWRTIDSVWGDITGIYRVATPIQKQPRYGTVVHIRRHRAPHQLFPKPAH